MVSLKQLTNLLSDGFKSMKKLLVITIVGVAASAAFAAPVPKAIKARYSRVESAMRKLDFKAFSEFFADDFTIVDPKGKSSTREEFLKEVEGMFEGSSKANPEVKLISSTTHGEMVDVRFDFTLNLVGKGKNTGTTVMHEVGTDTWKMVGKQWMFVKTVDTKMDVTMPKAQKTEKPN